MAIAGWNPSSSAAEMQPATQSLNEYEVHLTDKLQFLLTPIGFIHRAEHLFKVMTIWSVVGIPPVLFAGIWG
jgi:magnesium transporter